MRPVKKINYATPRDPIYNKLAKPISFAREKTDRKLKTFKDNFDSNCLNSNCHGNKY